MRAEQAEVALVTAFLCRSLSVAAVKEQEFSLLGRLEGLGQGAAAAGRGRSFALQQPPQGPCPECLSGEIDPQEFKLA